MSEDNSAQQQIYIRMDKKETAELLEIWQNNNREDWTADAFESVHNILLNRLGSVPEQGITPVDNESPSEDEDSFPSPKLIFIATWADKLAWLVLGLSLLLFVIRLVNDFGEIFRRNLGFSGPGFSFSLLLSLTGAFYTLSIGVIYFVILMVISEGVKYLSSMHEN